MLFFISLIFLSVACTKQDDGPKDPLEGTLVEIKFTGHVSDGSQITIDNMKFYFQETDTTNTINPDPYAPVIIEDEPFSIALPASTIYRKVKGGWRSENIPVNMMPYHFAVAFNVLKAAKDLKDKYELIGNTTTAILSSAVRVKNIQGNKIQISASEDMAVQIKVIE